MFLVRLEAMVVVVVAATLVRLAANKRFKLNTRKARIFMKENTRKIKKKTQQQQKFKVPINVENKFSAQNKCL